MEVKIHINNTFATARCVGGKEYGEGAGVLIGPFPYVLPGNKHLMTGPRENSEFCLFT